MSKTTFSASATGLPEERGKNSAPCRVAQLAQDAKAVIDAHARADEQSRATAEEKEDFALDIQMRVLNERLDGLEKAAAVFPATSAIGAMFHLSLIKDAADVIESWVPENSERKNECDEARKAIVRMCYSVEDYIGAITGAKPADACAEYFMSEKHNPHRLIDAAIAQKDAARWLSPAPSSNSGPDCRNLSLNLASIAATSSHCTTEINSCVQMDRKTK